MPAEGSLFLGNKSISFKPKEDFGALDWGRGVEYQKYSCL
jgi:hypothetical protein